MTFCLLIIYRYVPLKYSVQQIEKGLNFVIQFIGLFGLVAQLVEQRTENPCVGGSIPPRATFKTLLNWGVFWLSYFPILIQTYTH